MTDPKDFENDPDRSLSEDAEGDRDETRDSGAEGSGADASGPAADAGASADELTVDDILGTAQSEDALAEDASTGSATGSGDPLADAELTLLTDLKRLQAEYANYRRRTEDQRSVEIARAKGEAAKGLLPVLDDLDRAAQHGDLVEGSPFAAISDKLRAVVERLGVVSYGEKGEDFDPQQHEAIFQQPMPGVPKAVVLEVVEVGYRLGDVELRPAKVVVAVPAE